MERRSFTKGLAALPLVLAPLMLTGAVGRPAQVYEVEPLGGYTVVTVDAGSTRFRALVRGQSAIRPEASAAISCDPSRVHYFNAAGDAIAR